MRTELRLKIIDVCDQKMEVATWWIQTHKLDHFVKAYKIKEMIQANL